MTDISGSLRTKWQNNPDQSSLDRWQDVMAVVGKLKKDESPLYVSLGPLTSRDYAHV